MNRTQQGIISLPILVAIIGVLVTLTVLSMAPFKRGPLSSSNPKPESFAAESTMTIIFDDLGFAHIHGVYPPGVIDWGDGFVWHTYNPEGLFTTYNVSYNDPGDTTMPFTFVTPRKLISFDVYNRGNRGPSTTITVSCAGNPTVSQNVPALTQATIVTNWTNPCTTVDLASTNGWDARYDNFVVDATGLPSPSPTISLTPTPTPTPLPATAFTADFNNVGTNVNFAGDYPSGVINWVSGPWFISAPWKAFMTNNLGFRNNTITSGVFNLLQSRTIVSIEAYNGGTVASTVTLSCSGNTTKSVSVPVNQLATIVTGWNNPCSAVTLTSSNSWDTNFDNLVVGSVSAGTSPSPLPSSGQASPIPSASSKPGDVDGDNDVDIFDYNLLLTNFGKTANGIAGDLDGDNDVDIFDYNTLLNNFGH